MKDYIHTSLYKSPYGLIIIGSYHEQICLCEWVAGDYREHAKLKKFIKADIKVGDSPINREAARQLDEYFARKRQFFELPLLICGDDTQQEMLMQVSTIPFGKYKLYWEISALLDNEISRQQISKSLMQNPIAIIIPSHRVVGNRDVEQKNYTGEDHFKRVLINFERIFHLV